MRRRWSDRRGCADRQETIDDSASYDPYAFEGREGEAGIPFRVPASIHTEAIPAGGASVAPSTSAAGAPAIAVLHVRAGTSGDPTESSPRRSRRATILHRKPAPPGARARIRALRMPNCLISSPPWYLLQRPVTDEHRLKKHTLAPSWIAVVVALAAAAACGGTSVTSVPGSSGGTTDGGADDSSAACDSGPCATDEAGSGPFGGASLCTSGTMWTRGDRGSASMHPGGACITCHDQNNQAPSFTIAGTVFPTGHEPDDCNGASGATSGAQIVITDANGKVTKIAVNSVGNFNSQGLVALPFRAKVVVGTKERAMVGSQKSGDCNACHTEKGENSAPGRIVLP